MVKKEEILARTSNGLDVFRHYLPVKWRVGRNFLNPLYADSKASCNVYYDRRSGTYRMKDFGNGDYSGDCFFLVAKLKGLDCRNAADFVEVLHTIDRELCLGLENDSPEDTAVSDGGCRTLRLVPGAREHGTRDDRSGEGISVRTNGNGTGKPDGYTEEAAAPFDRPEPKPTGRRKSRLRMRNLPTGAHRASRRSCCTVTGRCRSPSTGARRGRASRSASVPPRRNRCSATRGNGA